jgi:tetratricopeptide (TPR) repeat protein
MNRCTEAYNYAIQILPREDINYKVIFHCELAYDFVRECMYDEAEKKFRHIEKLIGLHKEKLNNTTMHHYYYWRGIMHRINGSNALAIRFFNKALVYADKNIEKLNALSNIGYCYRNLEKYKNAHKYYNEALEWQDEADILATACMYNNIACLYRVTKDYENAIISIEKAIEMSKNESSLSKRLLFESTYAEIKTEMGDKKAYKSFFNLLLKTKGKTLYDKPHVLNAIKTANKYIDDISCLYKLANIIIELKNASNSDGYTKGLVECLGHIFMKVIELKGVYNEKV